jgi:6,7-dimethyl-8-ribityllumazine synthase
MSKNSMPRPPAFDAPLRIAFVASEFNSDYVNGLIDHATKELNQLAPKSAISMHRVPGAFEIPVLARELASRNKADAIIAFGVILKGKTNHAKNLARSVTNALQQIAIDHGVPVINGVLSLNTKSQARERCLEEKINRGTEAAQAAVAIAKTLSELRQQ